MAFGLGLSKIVVAIVAIIIIAAAVLAFTGGTPTLSTNKTLSINLNSSYEFHLPDSNNVTAVFLARTSNSSAILYLATVPVLSSPISAVQISDGQSANISSSGSTYADIQVTLISSNAKSSTILLSYVPRSLYVRQSSSVQLLNGSGSYQQTTIPKSTNASGTTTVSATTTVSSGTTAPTTTVFNSNPLKQAVLVANTTSSGSLMVQWNALYQKEATSCTANLYNSDFAKAHNQLPSGPSTFANTSQYVPKSISASAKSISPNIYNVTYTAVIPAGNTKILVLELNVSGQFILASTYTGIFKSYTDALQLYQTANITSDPCSVYVG